MSRANAVAAVLAAIAWVPATAWAAGANKPPVVKLTAPTAGQVFTMPPSITLAATATDANGVAKVDFYRGSTLIGTDTTAPYSVDWLIPPVGTYSLTARATDALGATATSAAVSISVVAPVSALITSPANGAALYGSSVTISGTFNGDKTTTAVIADNGNTSRMAVPASNSFAVSLPLLRGANTLTVTAARNDKTFDTYSVTVTGNDAPYVALRSPAAGTHDAPASLELEAEALSPGGSIGRVEFLIDGTLRGTDTSAPYQYTWSNPPFGSHTLIARAYDDNNVTATDTRSVTIDTPNTLPGVTLTAPADGAVFPYASTITLQATASDPDGSVNRVEFLRDGAVIGTDTTSPYSFNWTNAQPGSYTVAARAVDNRSGMTTSAVANVTVNPPNVAPSVSLDAPLNGEEFTSPANILLAASAADGDGTVMWVEFYAGSTLLGTDSSPPYEYAWNSVFAGTYALRARAVDNMGAVTDSAVAMVTVVDPPNELPTVSLDSPADGATFGSPADIPLAASAADSDGNIVRVEFYAGSTLIGTVTSAPYTMNWLDVPDGSYAVTARAVDDRGGARVSAAANITVTPNAPPTVSVSTPAEVYGPTTVTLTATAADSDGTVTKVDFYANGTLLGTDNTAPYSFDWVNGAAGTYSIAAVATDDENATGTSPGTSLRIKALTLSFTTPSDGVLLVGNHVVVRGTFDGPFNSGVMVNGEAAAVIGNQFNVNIPLVPGSNTITATLATPDGVTLGRSISVTSDGLGSFLHIAATPLEGIVPLDVTFSVANETESDADVVFDGSASFTVPAHSSVPVAITYGSVGARIESFTASNAVGQTLSEEFVVVTHSPAVMDQTFNAIWNGMNAALLAGDKAAAMNYLGGEGQQKYGPVFDTLMGSYSSIAASFSPLSRGTLSADMAEYVVTREIQGRTEVFFIYFLKGPDGVWRLESM